MCTLSLIEDPHLPSLAFKYFLVHRNCVEYFCFILSATGFISLRLLHSLHQQRPGLAQVYLRVGFLHTWCCGPSNHRELCVSVNRNPVCELKVFVLLFSFSSPPPLFFFSSLSFQFIEGGWPIQTWGIDCDPEFCIYSAFL